jgi:DNA-binding transcriptional MerR regulator
LADKGPDAFRTISEAAAEVREAAHVLRFWETKFSFIRPMRRMGGRRFYRPGDVLALKALRRLLHEQGYAIAEIQRLSRSAVLELASGLERAGAIERRDAVATVSADPFERLRAALAAAVDAKARLDAALAGG